MSTRDFEVSEAVVLRMAQTYLARRAASLLQLRKVLVRKLDRRFAVSEVDRPNRATIDAIVERVVDRIARAGLIDEAALARSRADTLAHKGFASRVIRTRLAQQGLAPDDSQIDPLAAVDDERQARRFAQRKRLGAWHSGLRPVSPERDLRSMIRAGFSPDLARRVLRETAAPDDR